MSVSSVRGVRHNNQTGHLVLGRFCGEHLGNEMFGWLALFLDRHFWIDRLGHMYFVAGPLLSQLIGIMGIGIMRVLYRARRSLGNKFQLSLDHFKLLVKDSPQKFHRFAFSELRILCGDPLQQISHILSTLPMAVSLLDFA
jgi:hypothetical protein